MQYKKMLLTVGAVGALGVAGSFGTYAAFTDELPAQESQFKTGLVKVTGGFNMPDVSSLATQEPARAGDITVTNTGTEPINVYMDWDGPVGTIKSDGAPSPTNKTFFSDDVLAENIQVDTSYNSDFTGPGDDKTRLWKINDRGLSALYDLTGSKIVLNPGQSKTVFFRVRLREQGPNAWGSNSDDNVMQGKAVVESIKVKAIEAGNSVRGLGPVGNPLALDPDANLDGYNDTGDKGL
jgi:predicted ribosomally synthesized peptide with SipW-like signal peptide